MLKIYFDWNCITHSKDKYPYILNIAEECRNMFIFPFSNAHIRDVLVSHKEDNNYFDNDIKLLERICGNHHLLFKEGQMTPIFATPSEIIETKGYELEMLQKTELITPQMYSSIKEEIKNLLQPEFYKEIQGTEPKNLISKIDKYLHDVSSWNIETFFEIGQKTNVIALKNAEFRFKTMCFLLDMLGFRPEKKSKHFMNIDTDASHIFYAGHCDVFVTADSKLRGKAEAMYQKYNYQTKILHPKELESFIEEELQNAYSFDCISKFINDGIPKFDGKQAHYKLLKTQVFGMFNVCCKMDEFWNYNGSTKAGLFRYCFNNTPYLFLTELAHFCKFFEKFLTPSQKEDFRKCYTTRLLSGNREITAQARYTINIYSLDIVIELFSDPDSPIPSPMMLIIQGDEFEQKYNKHTFHIDKYNIR